MQTDLTAPAIQFPDPSIRPTGQEAEDAIRDIFATAKKFEARGRELANDVTAASEKLIAAIRCRSGQSEKIAAIIWSLWNDHHQVSLCDALCGLDFALGKAVLILIEARMILLSDADPYLRHILEASGEMARFQTSGK